MHTVDAAGIPRADRLIEGVGLGEHVRHIRNVAGIPRADRPTDRLIEGVGLVEHVRHIRNVAGIPRANRLIEDVGTLEHARHIANVAGIPRADRPIEVVGRAEHITHIANVAGIPRSDVLVEAGFVLEQFTHIAYFACHYFGDILVVGVGGDHSPQLLFVDDGIGNAIDDASIAILGSLSELYRDTVAVELQALQGVGLVAASATAIAISTTSAIVITGAMGQAENRHKGEDGKNWPPARSALRNSLDDALWAKPHLCVPLPTRARGHR